MHVTKDYFIQLVIKIKYVEFEDNTKYFLFKKTWECESFTARRLIKEVPTKKNWQIRTLDDFLRKLLNTGSIECIVTIDFKMCVCMSF